MTIRELFAGVLRVVAVVAEAAAEVLDPIESERHEAAKDDGEVMVMNPLTDEARALMRMNPTIVPPASDPEPLRGSVYERALRARGVGIA